LEEISVTGIVLSSMPYREKDKLIHIFSVELGKITAILKGVNSANAKLKFAGQPFCFAKFDLAGEREILTVKGAELIDAFFDLTQDYDNYLLSSSMLETCSVILKPGIISEQLFLTLIRSLQNIVYNDVKAKVAVLKFYLTALKLIGYRLNYEACDNCGMAFVGDIKFDKYSGTFRCSNCSGGIKLEKRDFMTIKIIDNTIISRLHTLKLDNKSLCETTKLILSDVSERLNFKFKSIDLKEI